MIRQTESGRLIVIVGQDGTGKTSLAHEVINQLSRTSVKAVYVWSRYESSVIRLAVSVAERIRGYDSEGALESYEIRCRDKKRILRFPPIRWGYVTFVLFSYAIYIRKNVIPTIKNGVTVISDRYIHDTAVDLWVDLGKNDEDVIGFLIPLQRLMPKPNAIYRIDVPEEVSIERKDDIPSVEFLSKRRKGYATMSEQTEMISLDGTDPLTSNAAKIIHDMGISARSDHP